MTGGLRFLLALLTFGLTLLALPLAAGYASALHPAFDTLAHFRLHLAALMVLLALPLLVFRGWRIASLLAIALGGAAVASVTGLPATDVEAEAGTAQDEAGAPHYGLLHLNLLFSNRSPQAVLSLIGRVQPDVITLNEVSREWQPWLDLLAEAYPYQVVCQRPSPVGGVAILSRRPLRPSAAGPCFDRGALAIATTSLGGTAVDIAALHLGWPWPFEQSRQLDALAPILRRLGPTAILAGDLNATPWSDAARRLGAAGGLTSLGYFGPTWLAPSAPDAMRRLAGLPIDNLFVKGAARPLATSRLEDVGSDHLPVLLEFSLAR